MGILSGPPEVPLGLGMALAKNPPSMESFAKMTNEQKKAIIEHTHSINSPQEMQSFVQTLSAE